MREGRYDLMLLPVPSQGCALLGSDVITDQLTHMRLGLACRSDDPLAHARNVTCADLADRRLIAFSAGWGNRAIVDSLFAAAGIERTVALEVVDTTTALTVIHRNLSLAFVPQEQIATRPGITQVDLAGPTPLDRPRPFQLRSPHSTRVGSDRTPWRNRSGALIVGSASVATGLRSATSPCLRGLGAAGPGGGGGAMSNRLTGAVVCGAVAVLLLGFALREAAVVRRLRRDGIRAQGVVVDNVRPSTWPRAASSPAPSSSGDTENASATLRATDAPTSGFQVCRSLMLTIQVMPNLSVHMPNTSPHICFSSGTDTLPPSDSLSQ